MSVVNVLFVGAADDLVRKAVVSEAHAPYGELACEDKHIEGALESGSTNSHYYAKQAFDSIVEIFTSLDGNENIVPTNLFKLSSLIHREGGIESCLGKTFVVRHFDIDNLREIHGEETPKGVRFQVVVSESDGSLITKTLEEFFGPRCSPDSAATS
jgi:hypothetical protein